MATIDLVKTHPDLYRSNAEWTRVTVPPRQVIAVDGVGDPNTAPEYAAALEALYGIAYTAKFTLKKAEIDDFKVAPLEGFWWADDLSTFARTPDKSGWKWTMCIPVPELVTDEVFAQAKAAATKKHPEKNYATAELRTIDEGLCLQRLWIGPYSDEHEVLIPLHSGGLTEMGLVENGQHHEIYLNDPRRTDPGKLKTLLRQPVRALSTAG